MRFLLGLIASMAFAASFQDRPIVEVYLPPVHGVAMDLAFTRARQIVVEVYSEVGFQVIWRSTGSHPPGCRKEPLHQKIVLALAPTSPKGMSDWVLAYTNPYATDGPCVKLLMDRLLPAIQLNPLSSGYLLGNVLAHEMGHVLQGVLRHSETGVMKARWSTMETLNMSKERLHFTAEDVEFMLNNLESQTSARSRGPG
jgi:hypothetical protein